MCFHISKREVIFMLKYSTFNIHVLLSRWENSVKRSGSQGRTLAIVGAVIFGLTTGTIGATASTRPVDKRVAGSREGGTVAGTAYKAPLRSLTEHERALLLGQPHDHAHSAQDLTESQTAVEALVRQGKVKLDQPTVTKLSAQAGTVRTGLVGLRTSGLFKSAVAPHLATSARTRSLLTKPAGSANLLAVGDPVPAELPYDQYGRWTVAEILPAGFNSVHLAVSPDGRYIVYVAGSGNNPNSFAAGTYRTIRYDTVLRTYADIPTPSDVFCNGMTYLDNRLVVIGGTEKYATPTNDYIGSKKVYYIDIVGLRYVPFADMAAGRWYPTGTKDGNGNIVVVSGLNGVGQLNDTTEIFNRATLTWTRKPGLQGWGNLYPDLKIVPSGRFIGHEFYTGGHTFGDGAKPPGFWDYENNVYTPVANTIDTQHRDQAAAFFIGDSTKGKIMIAGGGNSDDGVTLKSTAIIDVTANDPTYVPGPDLLSNKMYVLATGLPTGETLVTGGSSIPRDILGSALEAQLLNPEGTAFKTVNPPTVRRGYHSASVLVKDGSVYVAGANMNNADFDTRVERYEPWYMFKADPPSITGISTKALTYGATVTIKTSGVYPIKSVAFVTNKVDTHSGDSNQRTVPGTIVSQTATSVTVKITDNHNEMVPYAYMAFVLDSRGVPNRNAVGVILK